MIRINLLPVRETEEAASQRQEVSLAIIFLAGLTVVMGATWFNQTRKIDGLDNSIAEVERSIEQLQTRVEEVKKLEVELEELQAKLDVIAILERKRVGPVRVLYDLSEATPDRLWLEEITESGGRATIVGQAVDDQTVSKYLRSLEESLYFRNVELQETGVYPQGNLSLRRFKLSAEIDYAATVSPEDAAAAAQPLEAEL